jgi:hypothetical protein
MSYITCYIQGGLGNQLFIIFTTLAVAKKQNLKCAIVKQSDSPSITPRKTYFDTLLSNVETQDMLKFSINSIYREPDHMIYSEIPEIKSNTMITGYFQSRKYIDDIRDIIISKISLKDKKDIDIKNLSVKLIRDKANGRKCIFLHVRRGDYLNLSHHHYNLPMDYYISAIEKFKEKDECLFVIFSDDMEYCKEVFSQMLQKDEVYYCKTSKDYVELMIMSEMDGSIIANSSYSWWGAYLMEAKKELANKESPFIISPKMWITNNYGQNDRNIERHNWMFL